MLVPADGSRVLVMTRDPSASVGPGGDGAVVLIAPPGKRYEDLTRDLRRFVWPVKHAHTSSEALAFARGSWPDAFIIEQSLPDTHWADLVIQLRLERPEILSLIILLQHGVPKSEQADRKRAREMDDFSFLLMSLRISFVYTSHSFNIRDLLRLLKRFGRASREPIWVNQSEIDAWRQHLLSVQRRLARECES